MIGKNWMKAFAFAGASAAVAAAMPASSEARTHYTGKPPAVVSMMASTSVKTPVKKVALKKLAVKHTIKKLHHKKVLKASVVSKSHGTTRKTSLKKTV